jgi:hypothetical protein
MFSTGPTPPGSAIPTVDRDVATVDPAISWAQVVTAWTVDRDVGGISMRVVHEI